MNAIPTITKMEVFPVAGHDCMELNLSGAQHRDPDRQHR